MRKSINPNKKASEPKPKLIIEKKTTDRFLDYGGILILALFWAYAISNYLQLPDTIPVHFDLKGRPDGYGGKLTLLALPLLTTVLWIGLFILNRFPHIFNFPVKITPENAYRQYQLATRFIRVTNLSLVIIFFVVELMMVVSAREAGFHPALSVLLILFILMFSMVPMIIYFVKSANAK